MTEHAHWHRYLIVWIVLLGLTGLSYLAAQIEMGVLGITIGIVIATGKMSLVALYFMHLIDERWLYALVGLVTLVWVALLCAGVAADIAMR